MADLIIDLFAGGGGASEAIWQATGRHPDVAVNHDREAIALHTANHPGTLHLCDDIRQVDVAATLARFPGRHVGLLWASPDCKDHSKAKGGKPKDKNIRGLAWEVLRWSAAIKRATGALPKVIALENVEEYQDWGPLHTQGPNAGKVQKRRRGETFKLWVGQLKSLGFHDVQWRELVAADYGAPTTRKRLFLIARSDGGKIHWPEATHAPIAKLVAQGDMFGQTANDRAAYRSAAEIINWNLPVPSIFGRKRPLQPKTRARIAKGIKRYVIDAARPFIVKVTHTAGPDTATSADLPLQTVTTAKGGEFAVSAPTLMPLTHHGSVDRSYPMGDPMRTVTGANRGEFGLISPTLVPRYGERDGQEPRCRSVEQPYPTVVPDGNGGSLAAVHLTKFSENSIGTDPRCPLHTAMAGAPRHGVVAAYLGRQFGSTVSGRDMAEPHPAVMTDGGGGKSQVVAAHLGRQFGKSVGSDLAAPVGAVTAGGGGKTQLIAPVIDKYYGSGVAADAAEPLDTATAKARFGLAGAFMEQANTGVVGHDCREPVCTIVGAGSTQRLVDVELGDAESPRRRDVLSFLWEHFGEPTEAERADPLATARGRLRFGLVVLDGTCWQIVDIGMRMLTPRELYSAQGFRPEYEIEITFAGKPLTKTAQTRMAGNSVSPPPAAALLRANLGAALQMERAA